MTAGAISALAQAILIIALFKLRILAIIGLEGFDIPNNLVFIYQRITWGGIWGLLFLIPILRTRDHVTRGFLFAFVPIFATWFYFNPFHDSVGYFGLQVGVAFPIVVLLAGLFWGIIAGYWLEGAKFKLPERVDN